MLIISDRVKESSLTTGSGVVVFDSAFGGFQSFQTGIGDGNTTYYCIENGVRWEVGQGVYTLSGDTLSRDVVFDSSAGGAKINLEGVSTVFCTLPADKAIIQNEASGTYVVDISTLELNSSGIISNTLSNSGDAVFGNDVLVSGDLTVVGSLFGVDDISSSGDIVSSGFLTLIRPNGDAGNFFHAYKEDGTEQTAALHFDGNASPMWKLGLKSNPTSQTAPPTFAYVFAKDGSAGMVSNTNNYASISDGIGFTVYHDTNTVFRASSLTGVYIETTSSANPSLVVTGPPAPITDLQRWSLYDDTILSVIDSGGKIGILNDNPLYELDVNGSGKMDELYLTSGIRFQDGTFQNSVGDGNATHTGDVTGSGALTLDPIAISGQTLVTAASIDHILILDATDGALKKSLVSDITAGSAVDVSGWARSYVDGQDHSAAAVSGWVDTTMTSRDNAVSGWALTTMTNLDSSLSGWASGTIASGDTAVSGYFQTYVDSQDHSAVSVSGWANTTFDLQGVTDRGNVTTNAITINNDLFMVSGHTSGIDLTPLSDAIHPPHLEGRLFYDSDSHALTIYNDEADVSLQLGQEEYLRVRNDKSYVIPNGSGVYIDGSQGTHPTVDFAIASGERISHVVGLSTHDIEPNSFGYITTFGIVRGLDTSAFSDGDNVYLSATASGTHSNTPPVAPNYQTSIGHVIRSHASNGTILVQASTPKLGGNDVKNLGNISNSGIAFFSQVTDENAGILSTDSNFYYDSGNAQVVLGSGGFNLSSGSDSGILYRDGSGDVQTDGPTWDGTTLAVAGVVTIAATPGVGGALQDWSNTAHTPAAEVWTSDSYSGMASFGSSTAHQVGLHVNNGWPGLALKTSPGQVVIASNAASETAVGMLTVAVNGSTTVGLSLELAAAQSANAFQISTTGTSAGDVFLINSAGGWDASPDNGQIIRFDWNSPSTSWTTLSPGKISIASTTGQANSGSIAFGNSGNQSFGATATGAGTDGFYWTDRQVDSATSVGGNYDATNLTTAGAKIFRWQDASGEVAYIGVGGDLSFNGVLTQTTSLTAATGNEVAHTISYTTNKLTSGDDTGLLISKTDTASPGTSLLLDCQVGGASKASIDDNGLVTADRLKIQQGSFHWFGSSASINYGFEVRDASSQNLVGLGGKVRFNKSVNVQFCTDADINTPDEWFGRNTSGGIDIGKDTTTVVATIAQDGYGIQVTASAATDVPLSITGAASQSANMTEWKLNGGAVRATVTAAGEFTNNAGSSGIWNEAFGLSALTGITSGQRNVAIGAYSLSQVSTGNFNTAVGSEAATWVDGTGRTAVGYLAGKAGGGNYSIYLGYDCVPQTGVKTSCVFLGASQTTTTEQSYTGTILIGANVAANGDNEFIAGSSAHPINNVYFGKGFDNATPTAYTIHGTGGSGTDIAGADIVIAGGAGTGTGVGGDIVFKTAPAGTTGSSLNSLVTAVTIDADDGNVIFNGANIMSDFSGNPEFQVTNKGSSTTSRVGAVNSSWSEGAYLQSNNASAEGSLYLSGHKAVSRRNVASPVEFNDLKTDVDYIFRGDVSDIVLYMDSGLEYVGVGAAPTAAMLHVTSRAITDVGVTVTGAVGQTADLIVANDGSSDVFNVSEAGDVTIGNDIIPNGGISECGLVGSKFSKVWTSQVKLGPNSATYAEVTYRSTGSGSEHGIKVYNESGILGTVEAARLTTNVTLSAATGNEIANTIAYTVNKATSGDDTGLLISKTDTASPGTSLALDIQTDASSVFSVDDVGTVDATDGNFVGQLNVNNSLTAYEYAAEIRSHTSGGWAGWRCLGQSISGFCGALEYWSSTQLGSTEDAMIFGSFSAHNVVFSTNNTRRGGFHKTTGVFDAEYGISAVADAIGTIPITATGSVGQTASLGVFNNGSNDVLLVSPTGLMTVGDGTDADINLLQVNVTGSPLLHWDESTDRFQFTKGLHVGGDLYFERSDGKDWYGFKAVSGRITVRANNTDATVLGNDRIITTTGARIGWSSTAQASGSIVTAFTEISSGIVALGNGTASDKTGELRFATGEIQAIHQATEVTSLPTGTTQTITLADNNHQTLDLTSSTGDTTVTLTVPSGSSAGTLIIEQHATTARDITWAVSAGTFKWMGTEPTWSSDAVSAIRIVTWRYDGAVMYLAATDVAA